VASGLAAKPSGRISCVPLVSLIVPVLGDAAAVRALLTSLGRAGEVEIVIVDGGQDAELDALAAGRSDTRIVRATPGRARQMNAGAAIAATRWLLFLHADSHLPHGWLDAILEADRKKEVVGGWFRFQLQSRAWQARVIARLVAWRVRLFRLPYGDQGIFVRRDIFESLGGYREMPLMEDVDFVHRLVRAGRVHEPALAMITSARRYERDGWFRRTLRNLTLVTLYFAGVSPARLARWYQ
jgi:rSAM/selenodomain-associated transferase 2